MPDEDRLERARSFAAVAGEYERGRPGYPGQAIEWALGTAPLEVLDIGAGTGKLTRAVSAAGHTVTALEPLREMRELLEESVPEAKVLEGSAEELPLQRGSVDAVVVGAAFHWFDQERALDEIVRVLRPPGTLVLLGNSFDDSIEWQAELRGILGPVLLGRPGHWPDPERLLESFEEVDEGRFPHSQPTDLARVRDYASSRSGFAVMDEPEREIRLEEIDELWQRTFGGAAQPAPELHWIARVARRRGLRPS